MNEFPFPFQRHGPETLDAIARLWALGQPTLEIARRLEIPKNSVCRLARTARLRGDPRFPARRQRIQGKAICQPILLLPAPLPVEVVPAPIEVVTPPVATLPPAQQDTPPASALEEAMPAFTTDFLVQPVGFTISRSNDPDPRPRLFDLTIFQCHYPLTHVEKGMALDHRFCAAPKQAGSPYCPMHYALCYNAPRPRAA